VGRTLLSDAFDVAVELAVALAVGVARVGRTLLSDAFDLGLSWLTPPLKLETPDPTSPEMVILATPRAQL